ncbi:MAG: regulatory protein GntR [Gemmatimonadetes bacterium]|nr:regulatory protein GntR [Gemmatimonadota bacterium]
MVLHRRREIVDSLRQRIARALATGSICAGDRLASTREMAHELSADPRVVSAAFRVLEAEGLVEIRARSGVYVRMEAAAARSSMVAPVETLTDVLTNAVMRGYSGPEFAARLNTLVAGRKLRTVVLATLSDQVLGIARELREDFGLDAVPLLVERMTSDAGRRMLKSANLIVTTERHRGTTKLLAEELGITRLTVSIRKDLFESEWALWRGEPVHIVVLDARFRSLIRKFLTYSGAEAAAARVHLATDDLSRIPGDAPTYVTQAARTHIGKGHVPGMMIPPTRLFAEDCVRELWRIIGSLNLGRARA